MTDCGCEKAKADLEEYLHGELPEQEFREIAEHLDTCVDCKEEHLVGVALMRTVRRACVEVAPDELRVTIINTLHTSA